MKLFWLINRLSKMPLPEIPWRIWEKTKKILDKKRTFRLTENPALPHESIFLLSKHANAGQLKEQFPCLLQNHLSISQAAIAKRFYAFGIQIDFGKDINWHFDPVTHKSWPQKFWGDIDYRDKTFGGVKFVWEFNRMYSLFSLGLCFHLTKESRYGKQIFCIIQLWMDQNPYPIGVNWTSGIEAGVRLVNLVWALSFLKDYNASKKDLTAINRFVWFHANHLHRYPSRYSSANNHLLAEAFGLFVAGLYFPHLPGAHLWLSQGRKILDDEAGRQILPDGGSFEYSTTYVSFVFDFFLLYRQMCLQNNLTYHPVIDERLEASCNFINSIMDQVGNVPNIGDQDSAVLVNFGYSNAENFQSLLNTGSVLFNDPSLARSSSDLKTFLLTGKTSSFACDTSRNRLKTTFHKDSGLVVIRDWVDAKEVLFTGNGIPLGMAPLYAHGHLDALSFTLSVAGREIFVDPGTYLYHNSGRWRNYFRSTAAHNTIRLNEMDLSKQTGDFMFGKPYRITENTLERKNSHLVWKAGHDAYLKKFPFAQVEREVVWKKEEKMFQIIEHVNAKKQTAIELFFHFHPKCVVEKTNSGFDVIRGDIKICFENDALPDSELFFGSDDPVLGWYSPEFNKIAACFTIRLRGTCSKKFKCITLIRMHT